jgi:hypothetical protein
LCKITPTEFKLIDRFIFECNKFCNTNGPDDNVSEPTLNLDKKSSDKTAKKLTNGNKANGKKTGRKKSQSLNGNSRSCHTHIYNTKCTPNGLQKMVKYKGNQVTKTTLQQTGIGHNALLRGSKSGISRRIRKIVLKSTKNSQVDNEMVKKSISQLYKTGFYTAIVPKLANYINVGTTDVQRQEYIANINHTGLNFTQNDHIAYDIAEKLWVNSGNGDHKLLKATTGRGNSLIASAVLIVATNLSNAGEDTNPPTKCSKKVIISLMML